MHTRYTRRQFLGSLSALPLMAALPGCSSSGSSSKSGSQAAASALYSDLPTQALKASGPITLGSGDAGRVISGLHFSGIGSGEYAIYISGNDASEPLNIVIKDCLFSDLHWAIFASNCANITVHSCRFENVGQGARFSNCQGVVFDHNEALNVGSLPLWDGWWATNMVQLSHCTGANNSVSGNLCDIQVGSGDHLEDIINFYNSGGTAASPALCQNNELRGGASSTKGGGIILGDMPSTAEFGERGHHITASDNVLVNTQSAGIGIAGGTGMSVQNNRVVLETSHSNKLGSGIGIGIYAFNYSDSASCSNHIVSGNHVNAYKGSGVANHWWAGESCSVTLEANNFGDDDLKTSLLPDDLFANRNTRYFSQRVVAG